MPTGKSRLPKELADVGPVATAWAIERQMQDAPRKEVLAVCKEVGINPHTADLAITRARFARRQEEVTADLPKRPLQRIVTQYRGRSERGR